MDDLDRMFRRLVQNIRNGFPEYLTRPFEVAELYQSIIPYRHNRRELGIETNQDYELALCQLLAGSRGYVEGEEIMQETIRRELAGSEPNSTIYREFAATRVTLAPSALRRYEQLAVDGRSPTPVLQLTTEETAAATAPSKEPARRGATGESESAEPQRSGLRPSGAGVQGGSCQYCGSVLPEGRRSIFCPACGQNLTVQRCPACATELDSSWKFCITCGRGVKQT
jgi:hypothetical protein